MTQNDLYKVVLDIQIKSLRARYNELIMWNNNENLMLKADINATAQQINALEIELNKLS